MFLNYLFILFGIIPFILSWPYLPFVSWSMEACTVIYCLFVMAAIFWKTRDKKYFQINPIGITAILVVMLIPINSFANEQAYLRVPIVVASYMITVALLAMAVKRAQDESVDVAGNVAIGIFYGSFIQIIFGYLQFTGVIANYSAWMGSSYLWIPRYPLIEYATGLFFQANHFVDFIFVSLSAGILLVVGNKMNKYLLGFWIIIAAGACALAGSRSSYLYIFVFLVLAIVVLIKNKNPLSKKFAKLMMASSLSMLILQLLLKPAFALLHFSVKQGLDRLSNENLFGMRMRFWEKGIIMLQENPWFGVGWGNYGAEAINLQRRWPVNPNFMTGDFFNHAHNIFIQLFAETGIIGTIPVIIGLYFVITSIFSGKWDEKKIFIISAVAVVFCHSQLEYPLWYSFFLLPAAVLVSDADTKWFSVKAPKKIINALVGFLCIILFTGSATSIYFHSQLVPIINASMAIPLTKEESEQIERISRFPLLAEMADFARLTRIYDLSDNNLEEKLKLTASLGKTRPNNFVLMRRAIYLSYNGQYTEALECIDKAYINSGNMPDLARHLSQAKQDPRLDKIRDRLMQIQRSL